jgi:8-oxo-dGTP diphosphatase
VLARGGQVLIAQRPPGKIAAGKWEFPGGKIEPGESPYEALRRELREELGVEVRGARRLLRFRYTYTDRIVVLDTWLVDGFEGEPHPHEGQQFLWSPVEELQALDTLPTVAPIALALRLPEHYVFTPPNADEALVRRGLPRLPAGCLLRLRVPALDDAAYAALAARLLPDCRSRGIGLMLDRQPRLAVELGAAGWHATERVLLHARSRPVPDKLLFAASVHDPRGLEQAWHLRADFAVLGPVLPTATHPNVAGLGWDGFEKLLDEAPRPVYAIGGAGPWLLPQAHQHGAQGVAGIRAYWP